MTALPFSLLFPVYAGDRHEYVERSLRSAVVEQVRRPSDVVIVQDGPIGPELTRTLQRFRDSVPCPVTVVELQHNVGLGRALDEGLRVCRYDVVARQDADDVSVPHRFAVLLPLIEQGAELVGSGLLEIGLADDDVVGRRTPPVDADEIARYARFHDPFNHPTVVYRRRAVDAVGGYEDLPLLEDYWLFARMIHNGARVMNVPDPLVLYRVGAGSYARRGGRQLLRSEIELQRRMHASGFTSSAQFARNVTIRGGYRLVPERIRRWGYQRLLGHWGDPATEPTTVTAPERRR